MEGWSPESQQLHTREVNPGEVQGLLFQFLVSHPVVCQINGCGQWCDNWFDAEVHLATVHLKYKPFECLLCGHGYKLYCNKQATEAGYDKLVRCGKLSFYTHLFETHRINRHIDNTDDGIKLESMFKTVFCEQKEEQLADLLGHWKRWDQHSFMIDVKTLCGTRHLVTVHKDNKLMQLKQTIQTLAGIPTDEQSYLFEGILLKSVQENRALSLAELALKHGAELTLVAEKERGESRARKVLILEKDSDFERKIGRIQVFVKMLTGKTASIYTHSRITVYFFKQQIHALDGTPPESQRLIYSGARNYGNLDRHPLWVFGLCWWHGSGVPNEVRFIHVEDRTAATLIPLIQHHLKPGTLIFSDEWRAYYRINQHGYEHHTVNHQEHYVHPVTQVNTQAIESHWERPKRRILKMCKGVGKDNLKYYLAEYWWRTCQMTRPGEQSKCLFELFLKAVASAYPLQ